MSESTLEIAGPGFGGGGAPVLGVPQVVLGGSSFAGLCEEFPRKPVFARELARLNGTNRTVRMKPSIGVALTAVLLPISIAAQTGIMDPQRSSLTVHVFKAGVFSAFGHAHEIRAPLSAGAIHEAERATVEIEVDARQLKVLDPDLPAKDRAEVQATMLGPKVLDSDRFPQIRFHSTAVEKKGTDHWQVRGELTLHGQTRPVTVLVTRHGDRYDGSANLRQSDFGITPVRFAGGTVKVKNEVQVDFDIGMKI